MTDDDVAVVRWYECERRRSYAPDARLPLDTLGAGVYQCPWDGTHYHTGSLSSRRGSGRRLSAARYHWDRHNEKVDA